jgi:ribosome-associated protein
MIATAHTQTLPPAVEVTLGVLDDKKAEEISILDVHEISSVTDTLIVATGTSRPHLRALSRALEEELKKAGVGPFSADDDPESGWIVIDGFDFMVHLFLKDMRAHYAIETLWKDAESVGPVAP